MSNKLRFTLAALIALVLTVGVFAGASGYFGWIKGKALTTYEADQKDMVAARREARVLIEENYGGLFEEISLILYRHDPIGINFGDNADEYEPEAGTIIPRLKNAKSESDVLDIVHEEFVYWFDQDIAGSKSKYEAIAQDVFVAWQRYSGTN